jgi:hypothetical protein
MARIRVVIIGMRVRIIALMVPIVRRGALIIETSTGTAHNATLIAHRPCAKQRRQPAPAAAEDAITQVQAVLPKIVMSPCADKAVHCHAVSAWAEWWIARPIFEACVRAGGRGARALKGGAPEHSCEQESAVPTLVFRAHTPKPSSKC